MTISQAAKDNVTRWLHWSARGIGLLAGAMALLVISGVASDWLLKGSLYICQPALEGPARWNLCRGYVAAMGGWADEIAASPWPLEGTIRAGLLIITVLGVLIAWSREGMGGVLLTVGAIVLGTFSYLTAEQGKVWNMLLMGGPTLVAGILFLACWRRSEEPVLSKVEGPVLSKVEGPVPPVPPVPSAAEGSAAEGSKVEGPVPSAAEGRRT
jgi:hypothetical protein